MNLIKIARKIFKRAFKKDPDFRHTYQANIAMVLYDGGWVTDYDQRNAAADEIIKCIFERN